MKARITMVMEGDVDPVEFGLAPSDKDGVIAILKQEALKMQEELGGDDVEIISVEAELVEE
jgi:hypothetical protein